MPDTAVLDYVNNPFVETGPTGDKGVSYAQYGIYDVLGETKLEDGPNPSKDPAGYPRFDIEDNYWGTDQYPAVDYKGERIIDGKNWGTNQLIFGLPSITEKPKTCEDNCIIKSKKRVAACNALRTRVKDALDKAGCPCDITGKDKMSSCQASSGFPARSRRSRSLRSRRSRPKRINKQTKRYDMNDCPTCNLSMLNIGRCHNFYNSLFLSFLTDFLIQVNLLIISWKMLMMLSEILIKSIIDICYCLKDHVS